MERSCGAGGGETESSRRNWFAFSAVSCFELASTSCVDQCQATLSAERSSLEKQVRVGALQSPENRPVQSALFQLPRLLPRRDPSSSSSQRTFNRKRGGRCRCACENEKAIQLGRGRRVREEGDAHVVASSGVRDEVEGLTEAQCVGLLTSLCRGRSHQLPNSARRAGQWERTMSLPVTSTIMDAFSLEEG